MIADLKPYPVMKDSGVEWLGDVPEDWAILRGRRVFEIRKRIAGELGHSVISVTQAGLRVRNVETGEGQVSQDYSKYQIVNPGDFAMNSMDLLTGGVGIADSPGVTSPDYRVFVIRDDDRCRDRYMLHVLRMLYQNRGFYAWGQGSAQLGRWRLPRKRFNNFPFPAPPPEEQAAIVRYLDHMDRRVRRLVRAKRKLIALLTEQKQVIIHRAVTRGLDPHGPLKGARVEWLGEAPAHWEVAPLKRLLSHMDYGTSEAAKADGNIRVLTMANIQKGEVVAAGTGGLYEIPEGLLLERHDLLFTRTNGNPDLVGKVGIFRGSAADQVTFASYLVRLRVRYDADPCWVHLLLNSSAFWGFARSHALVNLQTNLNSTRYGQFRIPVPPLVEQRQIVKYVEQETDQIADAAASAVREIELLNEYRTRLIADVVTGKLDVREAAAALPEIDPLDTETDLGADNLEIDVEAEVEDLDEVPTEAEA